MECVFKWEIGSHSYEITLVLGNDEKDRAGRTVTVYLEHFNMENNVILITTVCLEQHQNENQTAQLHGHS